MNRKDYPVRVDGKFLKELREIKLERIKRGIDKEFRSDRRLTRALIRSTLWGNLKEILINSELEKDELEKRRRKK